MGVTLAQVGGWVVRYLLTIRITDILDIAIMAFVLYKIFTLVQSTKAASLVKGLLIFLAALVLSSALHLNGINYIMSRMVNLGLLALIILFQPEIRRILEQVGSRRFTAFFIHEESAGAMERAISQTVLACTEMSQTRTGALIVIERTTKLGDIMKTGVQLDAVISQSLIKNIFFNKAALHDGAMIIRDNRIAAAGCFLPLTQNTQISKDKGTRHRAGVGVSEVSDAVVIIVSEETGEISLAIGGSLLGGQNYTTLRQQLTQLLFGDTRRKGKKDRKEKKKRAAATAAAEGEVQDSGTDKQ